MRWWRACAPAATATLARSGEEALPPLIASIVQPGDMVVCLGAGSIIGWAEGLRFGAKG